ncbi:hypothetical protein QU847_14005, partial [Escherichia coli]|nr:hypothetical protein [Escherichia coli]MDM8950489.1 hypothetical protein [Escherichia coli]MDM8960137.1 hypothetical protein [Escherichia coli]MDM8964831.1 hypothetical protein [Escherichia coli]MDM8970179.1 hypothetical protein [Escherichia coli]
LQPCLLKIYSHMVTFWGNYEGISQRYVATNATVTAGTANADSQFTVEYKK